MPVRLVSPPNMLLIHIAVVILLIIAMIRLFIWAFTFSHIGLDKIGMMLLWFGG